MPWKHSILNNNVLLAFSFRYIVAGLHYHCRVTPRWASEVTHRAVSWTRQQRAPNALISNRNHPQNSSWQIFQKQTSSKHLYRSINSRNHSYSRCSECTTCFVMRRLWRLNFYFYSAFSFFWRYTRLLTYWLINLNTWKNFQWCVSETSPEHQRSSEMHSKKTVLIKTIETRDGEVFDCFWWICLPVFLYNETKIPHPFT